MKLSKTDKLFRIALSKKGIKIPKTDVDLREAELALVKACIEQSANEAPKIAELRQRMNLLDEVDNIGDTDNYIDISKSDIELIKSSFATTAGRRPGAWLRCISLLDQLEQPTALDESSDS